MDDCLPGSFTYLTIRFILDRVSAVEATAEATVEVKNRLGLHLRAVSALVQTVQRFNSAVTLEYAKERVSARSIIAVSALGAAKGSRLRVRVQGPDADAALAAIKQLFDDRFGED